MAEELARADELRRKEADRLRSEMEDEKKAQGNSITQMFDRLKGENENRKMEIHGEKSRNMYLPSMVLNNSRNIFQNCHKKPKNASPN